VNRGTGIFVRGPLYKYLSFFIQTGIEKWWSESEKKFF